MQGAFLTKFKDEDGIFILFLVLALLVFCYHLGIMPLIDDEATRALVSLEMVFSGDYLVPTTHGLPYQNKPPLFNWFLALVMKANPSFNEFSLRVFPILALLATSVANYLFLRERLNTQVALLSSVAFLTCGRILFYDSMLAYIDPFFTLALLLEVFVLYGLMEYKSGWSVFPLAYFLCFVAYMLKGLPALPFHFFTLGVAVYLSGRYRLLFSLSHILGFLLFFLVPLGAYYLAYAKTNDVGQLVSTLFSQSSKRTVAEFGWVESLVHILTFPLQFVGHFLPWTLLAIPVLLSKKARQYLWDNALLRYLLLVFAVNIWVYWLSPETKPRYLFVFLPLVFAILSACFLDYGEKKRVQLVYHTAIGLTILCGLAVLVPMFLTLTNGMPHTVIICLTAVGFIFMLILLMRHYTTFTLVFFAFALLTVRVLFGHFVLPLREIEAPESERKKIGVQIGDMTKGKPLHLAFGTLIDHDLAYYISKTNGSVLSYSPRDPAAGEYRICSKNYLDSSRLQTELSFRTDFQNAELFLVKGR
jgi:4-amino-4-deoxy-L-arabinose transferase-like glycosyltransferase